MHLDRRRGSVVVLVLLGTACGRSLIDPGEGAGDEVAGTEASTDTDTEESTDTDTEESTDTDAGESTESESESTESESTESESESTESESESTESESAESESTESESESTESESETGDPPPEPAEPKVCVPCDEPWTLEGDLELIDAEAVELPACLTHITGTLSIRSIDDASILGVLEHLQTVDGTVFITNNNDAEALPDLSAVGCLEHVGGWFYVLFNDGLETLEGLENLHVVDNGITVRSNDNLVSMWGLSGLESVGSSFAIQKNPVLATLDGLGSLIEVGDTLELGGCQWSEQDAQPAGLNALVDLSGLDSLTSVGSLNISDNPEFVSFEGAPSLTIVSNYLDVHDNEQLDPALIDAFAETLDGDFQVNDCNTWDPDEGWFCGWCTWGVIPQ